MRGEFDRSRQKPLQRSAAAARLSIAVRDLPDLGRPWTRADVKKLRGERPKWLTESRRAYAAAQDLRAAEQRERLAAMLDEGGFTRADDGSEDLVPYTDNAYMYLLMVRQVPVDDAEAAVNARWPSTTESEDEHR